MAETGLVMPSLEELTLRKLRGDTQTNLLNNPQYMRSQALYEELLYNEQLNKDKPIPTHEPNILQRGLNAASNAVAPALDLGERIAGPIVELQRRTGQRERKAIGLADTGFEMSTYLDAVLPTLTALGSTAAGGLLSISNYLNRQGADIARRGPLPDERTNASLAPSDVRDIPPVQNQYTYQPRTEVGKFMTEVPQVPFHLITRGSELVEDAVATLGVPPERARAIGAAAEIAALYYADKGLRTGARSIGNKIKEFQSNLNQQSVDAAYVNALDIVNNEKIQSRLDAARERQQTAQNNLLDVLRQRGVQLDEEALAAQSAQRAARQASMPPGPTLTGAQRGTTNIPTGELTGTLPSRVPATEVAPIEPVVPTPPTGGTPFPTEAIQNFLRRAEPEVSPRTETVPTPPPTDLFSSFETATNEAATLAAQRDALIFIKTKALEISPNNLEEGLFRLGFGEADVIELMPWLNTTRIPRNIPPTEPPGTLPVETPSVPVEPTAPTVGEALAEPPSRPAAPNRTTQQIINDATDILLSDESTLTTRGIALSELKREALNVSPGKVEDGLRKLGIEEELISNWLPAMRNVRAARASTPRARTVGEAISEPPSTVQNLTPSEIAIDIPPTEPSPVKTPMRRQPRKVIPSEPAVEQFAPSYEAYQARVTARNGVPQPELLMGEVLRRNNITLSEAEFAQMAGEVSQFRTAAEARTYAENYIQRRGAEAPVAKPIDANLRDYIPVTNLNELPLNVPQTGGALSKTVPIQILREGGKPTAILINNNALHTRSLAHIEAEAARMERSNIPPEARSRINLDRAKIQAKADLLGISAEEAGTIPTTELYGRIAKTALDNDLALYKLTRNGLEEVPRNIVETTAKLNDGNLSNPKKITTEDRAQYMAEQARETSPLTIEQIIQHLTDGDDIRAALPPQLAELYGRALEYTQRKLTTPDRRSMKQILQSINNLLGERGAIGNIELSPLQKSAYNELRNDAIRMGKDIMDLIRGDPRLSTIEKRLLEEYSRSTKAPPPKPYMELNNMSFDSEAALRGDFVIKRAAGDAPGTYRPEIYFSDWMNVAAGDDIKARKERSKFAVIARPETVQTATRKLLAAGQEDIVHAYRGVEQNLTKDLADYRRGIKRIRNQFTEEQQRAIGADLFLNEGSIDLLIASNVEPRALNASEVSGGQFVRSVFEELFPRLQEGRKNTGREPMTYVQDYITHMRTITEDNALGVKTSLIEEKADVINTRYANMKNTPFPFEKTRRGGKFPAEINAFDILDRYVDYALNQIHKGPFVAKIHELIDTPIIDPTTNKTWNMKTEKPILYEYMKDWNNYIAGKPEYVLPEPWRDILFAASRSIGNAYIAGNPGSAIIQPTSLFNTYMHVGLGYLTKATANYLKDAVTPGHPLRKFRLENSKLLDTRNADIFFDEAGQGLLEYAMQRTPGLRTAGKALEKVSGVVGNIGTRPLRFLDQVAAEVTWDAGYEFAKKAGKADEAAFNVADDIVTLTQGSSLRGERAPIQRSQAGRALTQFQTFAINNYDFLTHDVLGIDNVKMTNQQRVRSIMKLIGAGTLFNILIEDVGGGNSPVPNPPLSFARSLLKGKTDNETDLHYLTNLVSGGTTSELLKVTPVLGSARYPRSQFGGPIASYANELIRAGMAPETVRGERETNLPRTIFRGMLPAGATLDKALLAPEKKNTNSFKTLSGAENKLRKTN